MQAMNVECETHGERLFGETDVKRSDIRGLSGNEQSQATIVKLSQRRNLIDRAAAWFSDKWRIPLDAYRDSMEASFSAAVPSWYLCMEGNAIIAGMGVIVNDFHPRKDLTPNVCAVYTEPSYRGQGIAGKLLQFVCDDMHDSGIDTLYLLTEHTDFYERYGWKFFCLVQGDGEDTLSRMYVHHYIQEPSRNESI